MVHKKFTLMGDKCTEDLIAAFVHIQYQSAYTTIYPGGYLSVYEDFSLSAGNDLLTCIRVDNSQSSHNIFIIEFICGGSRSMDILNLSLSGSEDKRLRIFEDNLNSFCKEKGLELSFANSAS